MGFFDHFFGRKEEPDQTKSLWKKIESEKDFESAIQESAETRVLIFKHSTRCFISKTVLKSFEKQMQNSDENYSYYFLDLISYRTISNEIESRFDVTHQSPQLIALENGKVFYSASHQSIDLNNI